MAWRLMQDSANCWNKPLWCSKSVPWKWVVLYRYPIEKQNYGFRYYQYRHEKTIEWRLGKWHYSLAIRLYRGRETCYRSKRIIPPKLRVQPGQSVEVKG